MFPPTLALVARLLTPSLSTVCATLRRDCFGLWAVSKFCISSSASVVLILQRCAIRRALVSGTPASCCRLGHLCPWVLVPILPLPLAALVGFAGLHTAAGQQRELSSGIGETASIPMRSSTLSDCVCSPLPLTSEGPGKEMRGGGLAGVDNMGRWEGGRE